jgi:hypothetical protein
MPAEEKENSSYNPELTHTGGSIGIKNLFASPNSDQLKGDFLNMGSEQVWAYYHNKDKYNVGGSNEVPQYGQPGWLTSFHSSQPSHTKISQDPHALSPSLALANIAPEAQEMFKLYFQPEPITTESTDMFDPVSLYQGSYLLQANVADSDQLESVGSKLKYFLGKAFVNLQHFIYALGYSDTSNDAANNLPLWLSQALWESNQYLQPLGDLDKEYKDITFFMQCPYSPLESTYIGNNLPKLVNAEIKNITSFNDTVWSNFTQTTNELFLPNLYVYLTANLERDKRPAPEIGRNAAFINLLHTELVNVDALLLSSNKEHESWAFEKQTKQQSLGNSLGADYFQSLAKAAAVAPLVTGLTGRQKNIVFTTDNLDLMKYSDHANIFPTYNRIEFTKDKESAVAQALYDTGLEKYILTHIAFADKSIPAQSAFEESAIQNVIMQHSFEKDPTNSSLKINSFMNSGASTAQSADFKVMMNEYKGKVQATEVKENVGLDSTPILFVGTGWKDNPDDFDDFNFEKSLKALILESKMAGMAKKYFRSLEEVYTGKEAYSETIAYKIEKYGPPIGGQPNLIQSFYFPNSENVQKFVYCDTQISYGEQYTYEIYAYRLVFGNKYKYLPESAGPVLNETGWSADKHAIYQRINYENSLHLSLIKVPYYGLYNQLQDKIGTANLPPLPPQVTFLPYRNVSDKLMLRLETNYGEYSDKPVIINDTDEEVFASIKETQNVFSHSPIKFKTDSPVEGYEILRIGPDPETGITTAPTSYADFAGPYLTTEKQNELIDPELSVYMADPNAEGQDTNTVYKPSPSVVLGETTNFKLNKIVPNMIYYYTFRSVETISGVTVMSNPTAVYKIEMSTEPGKKFAIPKISIYDMKTKKKRDATKTMQRFLKISPSYNMKVVNEETYDLNTSAAPELGIAKDALFAGSDQESRKFKVRLTSKSTGKKIDVNVRFDQKHTNGPPHKK